MSTQVTCPQCGALLSYEGMTGGKVKACPNCQTPIAFVFAPADAPRAAPSPSAPDVVVAEVVAEPAVQASPMPATAVTAPAGRSSALWLVLAALGVAGAGMLALIVVGVGIAVWTLGGNRDEVSADSAPPQAYTSAAPTVYASPDTSYYTPTESTYASNPDSSYSDPNAGASPAYDASYSADSSYLVPSDPGYLAPSDPGGATDQGTSGDSLDFFGVHTDRSTELSAAIEQDQQLLNELDAKIFVAGAAGGVGDVAERKADSARDQVLGALVNAGAEAMRQQLQSERDAVQIRLNANLAELARLQQPSNP